MSPPNYNHMIGFHQHVRMTRKRAPMSTDPAPNQRGPYRTGIRRREQIVEAATEVFAESGYAGGSIRAIAVRAGITNATLLQHFGSKEGLLQAVLEDWDRRA